MKTKRIISYILVFVLAVSAMIDGFARIQDVEVSAATEPVEENIYYNITNLLTGRLMDIPSGTDEDGALLHTWRLNGGSAQQFTFVKCDEEGYYVIVPRVAPTRALDNPDASTATGTQYQIYTQNNTDAQKFKLQSDGNGNYWIINKKSGMALTDMNTPNDEALDAVQQHTVVAGDNAQLWKISKYPNEYTFINPIKQDGADPWVVPAGDKYYLCWSNGDKKIYIRAMDKFENMRSYSDKIVHTAPDEGMYSAEIWAPELLWVDDHWYIYYAADDGTNANHRMYVLQGGTNPDNPLDGEYTFKGKIYDSSNDRWAIDGTVFKYNGQNYFVWSGWSGTDTGNVQNIYIAKMSNAWTLSSSRVCISEPTNSWEKSGSSSINEGPQILIKDNKVHIVYSAAGSWTDNYCLGLLTCSDGNFLNPSSWVKTGPVFKKTDTTFGVGHASFVQSKDGTEDWIIYHSARWTGSKWTRHIKTQLFTWDEDGYPVFGEPIDQGVSLTRPSTDSTPIVNTENYYKIVNVGTGRVLDIPNKGDADKVAVQTYDKDNGTTAQRFRFKSTGDAGWYSIVPKCAPTRALDNPASSMSRDISYQIYTQNGTPAQQFKLQHVGDGKYRIINKASLFALADTYELDGGIVEQRTVQNDDAQLWYIKCMTNEETYEAMDNVVVSADESWVDLGAWSYYFGSWNASNGTYNGGASADKFTLNITSNNKSQWGIQLALDDLSVVSGHEYQYTINVNSSAAGTILSKDDISNSGPDNTTLVSGNNVITGNFTASGSKAKILLELAAGIDVGTTLKFNGFSLVDLTAKEEETTTEAPTEPPTTEEPTTEEPTTKPSEIIYDENGFATSDKVDLVGYQISTSYEGFRVVGSVETEIDDKAVVSWGLVYGLKNAKGVDTGITNADMQVGANNNYVKAYQSTAQGTINAVMGTSKTATYYVRTMSYGDKNKDAFEAIYKTRAYAVLEDGTYVYSDVSDYSIYEIAQTLYDERLMNTYETHNYLYDTILIKVNPEYKVVDFEWDNTILKPF